VPRTGLLAAVRGAAGRAAFGCIDKHIGPKEKIGNNGGVLRGRQAKE
jgi:hypothetical protein